GGTCRQPRLGGAHVVVAVQRDAGAVACITHNVRPQEDHQVGLAAASSVVAEQVAYTGKIAQKWYGIRAVGNHVFQQAAQDDDLSIVDQHIGFQRPLARDDAGGRVGGGRVDAADFLVKRQFHGAA